MADIYNLRDDMQIYSYCPMMTCPKMSSQQVQGCMYRSRPVGSQSMNMYGAQPMWNSAPSQYVHGVEMKPVALEEITD